MSASRSRIEALAILMTAGGALWSVWLQIARGSDAIGWMALAGSALFATETLLQVRPRVEHRRLFAAALGFLSFFALGFFLPPLPCAALGVLALALAWRAAVPAPCSGLAALVALALPWEASLQFVLGFPLRRLVAELAAWILAPWNAATAGTALIVNGTTLAIDVPCSGVQGLLAFLVLGALVSAALRTPLRTTCAIQCCAMAAAILYNLARTFALALLELRNPLLARHLHEAVGVASFSTTAILFAAVALLAVRRHPWQPA